MSDVLDGPAGLVHRLTEAINARDLEAMVACFAPDYRNETPVHPSRGFTGRDQVRRNWEQIFAFIPDLTAEILRLAVHDDVVWTEMEHRGTRRDGSPHLMRGVAIFGVRDSKAAWVRFYLEPVDEDDIDVDEAVRLHLGAEEGGPP
jgi:ketosteroid isomerase-like protein